MTDTSHSHWSPMDENLERARFDSLQAKLADGDHDVASETSELASMAQSYGYGEADSFLHAYGKEAADDASDHDLATRESYESYDEGEYYGDIARSEAILRKTLGNGTAFDLAREACQGMRDAFLKGRKMRTEEEVAAPSP